MFFYACNLQSSGAWVCKLFLARSLELPLKLNYKPIYVNFPDLNIYAPYYLNYYCHRLV